MAIVTRQEKGDLLTHQELDGNFTHLDSKISAEESARIAGDAALDTRVSTLESQPSYTPPTDQGADKFLSGDGNYKTIDLSSKQDTLVSGTNIKTINGTSVLGSGDITISDNTKLTKANPAITGSITEQVYNLTGTAISPANGTIQYKTVSANTTFTETLTAGQSVVLRLIDANNYTITFPTITWVGAAAPTLTANCAIVLWKEQTTLYGAYVGSLV